MKLFMAMHVRIDDHQKRVQQLVDSWARHFMVYWFSTIFFCKLLFFFEIDDFFFQDTYNTQLKEIYDDNLSTHPDLDPDL
jgi:hypothetical protein